MRVAPLFKHEDKLVLAAVERAHPGIVLDPDAEIFQIAIDAAAGGHQLFDVSPVHADEVQSAVTAECREVPESLAEKGDEFRPIHLARGHREGTMVDRAETARMTIDRHVVGRVDEDHCGTFLAHQRREGRGIEGIAAQDTMAAEDPRIADLAERWASRNLRHHICRVGVGFGHFLERCDPQIDLAHLEAGHLDIEIEAEQR